MDALRLGGAKITYLEQENIRRCVYRAALLAATLTLMARFQPIPHRTVNDCASCAGRYVIRIKGDLVSKPYIDITLNL